MALSLAYNAARTLYTLDKDSGQLEPLEEKQNVSFSNAYGVVTSYNGTKNLCKFEFSIFENSTKEKLIARISYEFVPSVQSDAENFVRQAYEHLKTLPEYVNAENC